MSTSSDKIFAKILDHLRERDFPDEAVAYVDAHLADDPLTAKIFERLTAVGDELESAGLRHVIGSAMFMRALDVSDAKVAAELPFELDELTRESIDGAQSSPAMEAHCTSADSRQAAAVLNTVHQICRERTSYAWADELMREGPLNTYVQIYLSVIDEALACVSIALNDELRLLPKLDAQQDRQTGESLQTVIATTLVVFWAEDGAEGSPVGTQVHCGMSERYGAAWTRVVRYARQKGFPIHEGFQGELLSEERIDELLEAIEQGQLV